MAGTAITTLHRYSDTAASTYWGEAITMCGDTGPTTANDTDVSCVACLDAMRAANVELWACGEQPLYLVLGENC